MLTSHWMQLPPGKYSLNAAEKCGRTYVLSLAILIKYWSLANLNITLSKRSFTRFSLSLFSSNNFCYFQLSEPFLNFAFLQKYAKNTIVLHQLKQIFFILLHLLAPIKKRRTIHLRYTLSQFWSYQKIFEIFNFEILMQHKGRCSGQC